MSYALDNYVGQIQSAVGVDFSEEVRNKVRTVVADYGFCAVIDSDVRKEIREVLQVAV